MYSLFVPLHHYVIRRLSLVAYVERIRCLTCAQNAKTLCSISQVTTSYYSNASNNTTRKNAISRLQLQPCPNPPFTTTSDTPPLPHISATGPHIVDLPPTEPGLGLIHAAAARHAAPAEIRRRARVRPRSTGVVVGAAVEVGDGSRSVVPVFSVDGVAVFARGRDEAHCWCCG
jgi:hypothetical protein